MELDRQLKANEVAEANFYGKGRWSITKDKWGEWSLRTQRSFRKGDLVLTSMALKVQSIRSSHTIQTGHNEHVIMNLPCRFLNHSCAPNLGPWDNLAGAYDFIALRDIELGEELTFDYDTTEYAVEHFPDVCHCTATTACRKRILGYKERVFHIETLITIGQ